MPKAAYQLKHISQDRIRRFPPQYSIEIVQNPLQARACGSTKSFAGRRSIDPAPIIKVSLNTSRNRNVISHAFNFLFMTASVELIDQNEADLGSVASKKNFKKRKPNLERNKYNLIFGTTTVCANVASVPFDPDPNFEDLKAYFIFNDLSVRYEGYYRLNFRLWEYPLDSTDAYSAIPRVIYRAGVKSTIFKVYNAKSFPGLSASPQLTLSLRSKGSRIRVRKQNKKEQYDGGRSMGFLPAPLMSNKSDLSDVENNLKVLSEISSALRQIPNDNKHGTPSSSEGDAYYNVSYPYNNSQNSQFYVYNYESKQNTPQPVNASIVATATAAVQQRQDEQLAFINGNVTLDENIDDEFKMKSDN